MAQQLPCDICGKQGHPWFDCPQRATKPTGWKPERMMRPRTYVLSDPIPAADQLPHETAAEYAAAKKSTAAGKDRLSHGEEERKVSAGARRRSSKSVERRPGDKAEAQRAAASIVPRAGNAPDGQATVKPPAGTQALPVDTESKRSASSPQAKDRPLRGQALAQDLAIAQSPSGTADTKSPKRRPPLDAKVPGGAADPPSPQAQAAPPTIIKTPADAAAAVKRGRGRPRTGFDKKAYDREKARQRRLAEKGETP